MAMGRLTGLFTLVGMLVACASPPPLVEQTPPWQQMAQADLAFIRDTIAQHHPGPVDEENPAFRAWFEDGYEQALARVGDVRGFGAYQHVLRLYAEGFADEHLNVFFGLDFRWTPWAGIVLAWNGAEFELRRAAEDVPLPPGAVLAGCDGLSAEELWQRNVAPFYARAELPAKRFREAHRLLLSNGNPLVDRPVECTFLVGGEPIEYPLAWRNISVDGLQRELSAGAPQNRAAAIQAFGPRGAWLTLPTFSPAGEAAAQMHATLESLEQWRESDFMVVDVRGNSGGSSHWTEVFVRHLMGEAYYQRLRYELWPRRAGVYIDHRVSTENLEYFGSILPWVREQMGADSETYRYLEGLVDGLREALARGEALYPVRADAEAPTEPAPAEPAFNGRIIFLTDSVCVSACLNFSDWVLALPRVTHVGQPTSADTSYMEVRGVTLPSNLGTLEFATKAYRGFRRAAEGWYAPQVTYFGDISDTPRVEAWILETVLGSAAGDGNQAVNKANAQ
jgi:hypothetical protein